MRLNRHPEVNAGWIEFAKYMKYTRTSELLGIHGQTRNPGIKMLEMDLFWNKMM